MSTDPRYAPRPERELRLDGGNWRLNPFTRTQVWVPDDRTPRPPDVEVIRRTVAECGTISGPQAHRRRGEDVCVECRSAHAEYARQRYALKRLAA